MNESTLEVTGNIASRIQWNSPEDVSHLREIAQLFRSDAKQSVGITRRHELATASLFELIAELGPISITDRHLATRWTINGRRLRRDWIEAWRLLSVHFKTPHTTIVGREPTLANA